MALGKLWNKWFNQCRDPKINFLKKEGVFPWDIPVSFWGLGGVYGDYHFPLCSLEQGRWGAVQLPSERRLCEILTERRSWAGWRCSWWLTGPRRWWLGPSAPTQCRCSRPPWFYPSPGFGSRSGSRRNLSYICGVRGRNRWAADELFPFKPRKRMRYGCS